MKINNSYKRLDSLWGIIDEQHNNQITSIINGKKILDIGCGYGSLTNYLIKNNYDAEGIDYNTNSLIVAKKIFPDIKVRNIKAEILDEHYNENSFDTIILKDCFHHLVDESDIKRTFHSFRKILRNNGRIIILDPNPIWILRIARKLISHNDPSITPEDSIQLLCNEGFVIKGVKYYEILGLPLSGGYVGFRLAPNLKPLNTLIAHLNRISSVYINKIKLGKFLCWRYLIHADLV